MRKHLTRLVSLVLALALLCGVLPFVSAAQSNEEKLIQALIKAVEPTNKILADRIYNDKPIAQLTFDPDSLEALIRTANIRTDTVLYMDMGEKELAWNHTAQNFQRFTELFLEKGVRLTARIVPGGRHCEASWEKQIPFFVPALLYNLKK